MRSSWTRTVLTVVAILGFTVACGDSGEEPLATETAVNGDVINAADVAFAKDMIPQHAEAVQMVVLSQDRPLSPAARDLANGIREAQVAEVETMVGWLTNWGEEIPETTLDHANAGHGDEHSEDMAEDMKALADASDADFEQLWLEMMIEHHDGAIALARQQQEDGVFRPALKLARTIETAQERELAAMSDLLDGDS